MASLRHFVSRSTDFEVFDYIVSEKNHESDDLHSYYKPVQAVGVNYYVAYQVCKSCLHFGPCIKK